MVTLSERNHFELPGKGWKTDTNDEEYCFLCVRMFAPGCKMTVNIKVWGDDVTAAIE